MDELLATAAYRFVIGEVHGEDLPEIATAALSRDVDSQSLRALAGHNASDVREASDLFRAALEELQMQLPTKDEALWHLVRAMASKIVSGQIEPYTGASWIWRTASHRVDEEGDLRIFVGLASEREDHPEASEDIDRAIVDAAKALLARAVPRRWLRVQARRGELPLSRWTQNGLIPVEVSELRVGAATSDAIRDWAAAFESTFGRNLDRSGFASQDEAESFVAQGRNIVNAIQAELGESWNVEYYAEPVRPPGLRLRST